LEWAGTGEPVEAEPVKVIADWKFKDIIGDIEVIGITELKP
jgi:hypothetical protein